MVSCASATFRRSLSTSGVSSSGNSGSMLMSSPLAWTQLKFESESTRITSGTFHSPSVMRCNRVALSMSKMPEGLCKAMTTASSLPKRRSKASNCCRYGSSLQKNARWVKSVVSRLSPGTKAPTSAKPKQSASQGCFAMKPTYLFVNALVWISGSDIAFSVCSLGGRPSAFRCRSTDGGGQK